MVIDAIDKIGDWLLADHIAQMEFSKLMFSLIVYDSDSKTNYQILF